MRALTALLVLGLLATATPTATAALPDPDDLADPDCFDQLAQPYENPAELVLAAAFVAVCLATGS